MPRRYYAGQLLNKAVQLSKDEINLARKHNLSSFLLVAFYGVGIFFLFFNIIPQFIYLTPLTLLLSIGLVIYSHPDKDKRLYIFLGIIYILGLGIELIGVSSGLIFGEYQYGSVLGPKILGTPLMIGVNWAMLIYSTGVVLDWLIPERKLILKAIMGGLILVSLDILIEPVAMIYDFWTWGGDNIVPIQNYVAWFVLSFLFLIIYQLFYKNIKNNAAFTLLILQFIFFFLLRITW